MSGANSVPEAFRLYLKSNLCLSDASFYLRKWANSSEELMRLIDEHSTEKQIHLPNERIVSEDQSTYTKATLTGLEKEETNEGKVLGVLWNKNTDTFIFRFDQLTELARKLPPTKRNVLRLTGSIFDPLGIISPVILQMKLLFQSLCSQNYGWDTPLSEEHLNVFQQWVNELDNIRIIIVPRNYAYEVQENIVSYKLVGFGDLSVRGYCAVIHLVYKTECEFCSSQLMCTKSHVCQLGEI